MRLKLLYAFGVFQRDGGLVIMILDRWDPARLRQEANVSRLAHQMTGLSGGLVGCLCTAAAPNPLWLKVLAFCGVLTFMVAIHVTWWRQLRAAMSGLR